MNTRQKWGFLRWVTERKTTHAEVLETESVCEKHSRAREKATVEI